jgi:hypothetical protein
MKLMAELMPNTLVRHVHNEVKIRNHWGDYLGAVVGRQLI